MPLSASPGARLPGQTDHGPALGGPRSWSARGFCPADLPGPSRDSHVPMDPAPPSAEWWPVDVPPKGPSVRPTKRAQKARLDRADPDGKEIPSAPPRPIVGPAALSRVDALQLFDEVIVGAARHSSPRRWCSVTLVRPRRVTPSGRVDVHVRPGAGSQPTLRRGCSSEGPLGAGALAGGLPLVDCTTPPWRPSRAQYTSAIVAPIPARPAPVTIATLAAPAALFPHRRAAPNRAAPDREHLPSSAT